MAKGTRIVALDAASTQDSYVEEPRGEAPASTPFEPEWDEAEEPSPAPRRWPAIIAATLTLALIAAWTAAFAWFNRDAMLSGTEPALWLGWIRDWSAPVLLVAVAWLLATRNSRQEARRFGQVAAALREESERLETRLLAVNRELSLAREFLAAQSRDIESLGRVATERLSEHAGKLAGLVEDNASRIETIGSVSAAALDNMEKLRGQLPVIASSAKDVTNNIGTAGRTAHAQLEDMIAGFNKLNQFGQASERQVMSLRELVETTVGEFNRQAERLSEIAEQRFAALTDEGDAFRARLDAQEVEALAAIRSRANALADELDHARGVLDGHEEKSLAALRERLDGLHTESSALVRMVRDGEDRALEAWKAAIDRLEANLRDAIRKVGEIDEKAMTSARRRLAELAEEARDLDTRMNERDQLFEQELQRRRADFDARHDAFIARMAEQMAALDQEIAQRHEAQEGHARQMVSLSETVAAQLGSFSQAIEDVAARGEVAREGLANSLGVLGDKLAASREALNGTDKAVALLTDNSVRLLELIRAAVQHSQDDLPEAMAASEARLSTIEQRVLALGDKVAAAEQSGERLVDQITGGNAALDQAMRQIEALHGSLEERSGTSLAHLDELRSGLEIIRDESLSLAEKAQEQLRRAIEELTRAATETVRELEGASAETITRLAGRIGEQSGEAIEQAIRERVAEVAGQLDLATASAASAGREAAVQLRDQLAKVNELAGNLERRVAQARARAEERVDNDFARRVALITESLNSNAIDIASALDCEVTDTAWAAYLKGDRGIFTRRAVKLLDAPEARAVAQLYESDRDFRDHVSRYIHDFEGMLRQLLSTRDGHALGVTLLSADMGKLYVALAQAIERLRN